MNANWVALSALWGLLFLRHNKAGLTMCEQPLSASFVLDNSRRACARPSWVTLTPVMQGSQLVCMLAAGMPWECLSADLTAIKAGVAFCIMRCANGHLGSSICCLGCQQAVPVRHQAASVNSCGLHPLPSRCRLVHFALHTC